MGGGATLVRAAALDSVAPADAIVALVLAGDAEVAFGGGATATLADAVVDVVVDVRSAVRTARAVAMVCASVVTDRTGASTGAVAVAVATRASVT